MDVYVGEADERDRPLPVAGLKGTPEEIDRQWYEQVYRGRGERLRWRNNLGTPTEVGLVVSMVNAGHLELVDLRWVDGASPLFPIISSTGLSSRPNTINLTEGGQWQLKP